MLAELKRPDRGWNAVVVGERTRCWFGNQFSLIAPKFAAYGVDLWVPELGGKFEARNPSHKMLMSVLGGMSESERQHVQARVRAAMDAQVVNEGRHQGGRAPYGYVVVDAGPHPNPRKAAEGYRLRVLAVEEGSAEVVRRIFAEYLDGRVGCQKSASGCDLAICARPRAVVKGKLNTFRRTGRLFERVQKQSLITGALQTKSQLKPPDRVFEPHTMSAHAGL